MKAQADRGPSALRLCLLGRFELRSGDSVLLDRTWARSRAKALLKVVALESQIHRDRVTDLLWPDLDAQAGAANLRKSLHHLRTAVAAGGAVTPVVTVCDEVLQVDPEISVDVVEFRALAEEALRAGEQVGLDSALAAWSGELLPEDLYEEWTLATRRELQSLRRRLLVEAARLETDAGRPDRAAVRLEEVLRGDPFDEDVHRQLMATHARNGSRHRALRQFQECARLLRSELGLDPSAATVALHDAILAGPDKTSDAERPVTPRAEKPALFGREAELEEALDVVDAAMAGPGATVVVGGPAGIGKSRFAAELLAAAGAAGARVATGRSFELEGDVAYQPVRDALRQLAEDPAVEAALRHTVYAKRLLPGSEVTPSPVADPVLLESELVDEVVHALTRLATDRPLALLVEDVHAGDPATIRLLHVLGRRLAGCRGLLVVTYRSDEVVAGSTADRLIVSLRRHAGATEIVLAPMPDAAMSLVARERFGPEPVEPSLLRSVVGAAEGNPLFATELVDTLRDSGGAILDGGRWHGRDAVDGQPPPAVVRELVGRRLARLDDEARHLVSLASVMGRSFDYDRLRRCLGDEEGSMLDALDAAIGAYVLEEDGGGYRFRHELVRAAVYDGLGRSRRQQLHRLVGTSFEEAGVEGATGFHLARSDEPWRAVGHLRGDAQRAGTVFANEAARALFSQALAIALEHERRLPPATVAELLEELGDLAVRTGDAHTGAKSLREALDRYGALDDQAAVLRVRAKAALGHIVVGEVDAATELLQSHLAAWEQVLVAEAGEDMAALAPSAAFHMLADIRWHSGQHRDALEAAERAVGAAESSGDVVERAQAYEAMALACHSLGDWRRGLEFELQRGALGLPGFTDVALDAHY